MTIRFGNLRPFCDRTCRISICMAETLEYENYERIDRVPARYDALYLYGLGVIESEFPEADCPVCRRCLEIVLSEEPRTDV